MTLLSREFIAVPDDRKRQILFKWPDHEIRRGSQLIVEPDMEAVFISAGHVVATLGPGKHHLTEGDIIGLGVLIDAATGGNAFKAELFFVGTHEYVGQKFGGRIDDIQDPQSQLLVGMRVFGDYSLQIVDPSTLILQLTGTVDVADNDQVTGWFGEQLLKSMRKLVAKQVMTGAWPVVSTSAFTDEIEAGTLEGVNEVLTAYGAKMARLGNFDISLVPEDAAKLKQLAEDVKRSQMAGGYAQMAQVEMIRGAGEGLAQGGGDQAAFMGMGMGIGNMAMTPPAAAPVPAPVTMAPQEPAPAAASETATHPCPSCQEPVNAGAKFCAGCGTAQPQSRHCTNCGTELGAGKKFCAECGTAAEGA
ncbi:MAG TPA: SPFH domain-containing protein [Gaiellaceae bacterium]|jgi:membrane protease subunit (stomatin/prohibitin family)|nr:SPFH domain-containing protein [Gaiellaceae bacterium]